MGAAGTDGLEGQGWGHAGMGAAGTDRTSL